VSLHSTTLGFLIVALCLVGLREASAQTPDAPPEEVTPSSEPGEPPPDEPTEDAPAEPQPPPLVDEPAGLPAMPRDTASEDPAPDSVPAVEPSPAAVRAMPLDMPVPPEVEVQAATQHSARDAQAVMEGIRGFSFNPPDADVRVLPVAEFGALFVVRHRYQGGSDGTDFNLRRDGGQASAFLSWRISAELELFRHHRVVLLYQPIDLRTRATLTQDFRANGLTFPSGTPMQFRYGFDFYRLSYLYDFMPEPQDELAIGFSLQLRVANLEFNSLDGTLQRTSQNLGPVPLLKFRGRYTFDNDVFIGTEIDGIGIQFPSDQGSVLGLFFDTSIRAGYSPTDFAETYLNLRYLGGGARGPGSEPLSSEFGDGFNDNFIHALNLSVGFAVK